jgi:hypothetical protein
MKQNMAEEARPGGVAVYVLGDGAGEGVLLAVQGLVVVVIGHLHVVAQLQQGPNDGAVAGELVVAVLLVGDVVVLAGVEVQRERLER